MNIMQGSLVILDLGTPNVKYVWKGVETAVSIKDVKLIENAYLLAMFE